MSEGTGNAGNAEIAAVDVDVEDTGSISDGDLQVLRDNVDRARGKVETEEASLEAARAALEEAELELAEHEGA